MQNDAWKRELEICNPYGFENRTRTKAEYRRAKTVLEREERSLNELIDDAERKGFYRPDWYDRIFAVRRALAYCEFILDPSNKNGEDELI